MIAPAASVDQSTYQIRFEWGARALRVLAPAHVTVLVDALPGGEGPDLGGVEGRVVRAGLADRSAVARWILERQHENGGRTSVNVIALGDVDDSGGARFAMEDQLAAGAVVDALIGLGIDHVSPEAAVACASYEGLRRACAHLLTASESGRLLAAEGRADEVRAAARVDTVDEVAVLR
ncbi:MULTISPECIES: 2-phosphosulfolactate phosphatase [unclassified Rathayibacter]|uniref:2-phosphosulfolactate phosphatase n=1 Tax=unclassified Rathayibacter TaxID=2609250 RepID=UPI00215850F0|nr:MULTISPECIES: 2-phosphosulfolactate phosphatase [unclassified Rathayibacter]